MSLYDWIVEYLGDWIVEYPYILGVVELALIIIVLIVLQNMLYWLAKFISGER